MKKKMRDRIRYIFVLLSVLIIPAFTGALEQSDSALPIWSDRLGEYGVLVDCSDDGRYIVAGSDSGTLRMYTDEGKILWTLQREGRKIRSVAISGNGEYAGAVFTNADAPSQYADGQVYYFNRSGSLLWTYAMDSTVEHIAVSDDGNSVYVSGSPRLYSFDRNGTLLWVNALSGTTGPVRPWSLETTADGSYAIAGTQLSDTQIYAVERNGTLAWSFPARPGVRSVAVSSLGETVAGAGYSHLYSLDRNGTLMWQFNSSTEFTSVAVSSDGEYLAAGSQYYVRLFNRTGSLLWQYKNSGYVGGVALSANGSGIIAGTSSATILFDRSGKILWKYDNGTSQVAASKDGNYFTAGSASEIYFFNRFGTTNTITPVIPETISKPPVETTVLLPTTKPAPSSGIVSIIAASCAGVILFFSLNDRDSQNYPEGIQNTWLYPETPAVNITNTERPCKTTEEWYKKADRIGAWGIGLLFDPSIPDTGILSILRGHNLTVSKDAIITPQYIGYYLELPIAQYPLAWEKLKENQTTINISFSSPMYCVTSPTPRIQNDSVMIPVMITYSLAINESQTYQDLIDQDIPVKKSKLIEMDLRSTMNLTEQERLLDDLSMDDRILFTYKIYYVGVLC